MGKEYRYPAGVVYSGYDKELALMSVGTGWSQLIEELFNFADENKTGTKIIQVKEKWGGLRIYTDLINENLDKKIQELEKRSFTICEQCGASGQLRQGNWYRTLCDAHANGSLPTEPF